MCLLIFYSNFLVRNENCRCCCCFLSNSVFFLSFFFAFPHADAIPKVGYSTLIDEFVLYNMAFLFGQLFLCIYAHHLEHGGHEDDEDDDESPSHLMATHLPILFSLLQEGTHGTKYIFSVLFFAVQGLIHIFHLSHLSSHLSSSSYYFLHSLFQNKIFVNI